MEISYYCKYKESQLKLKCWVYTMNLRGWFRFCSVCFFTYPGNRSLVPTKWKNENFFLVGLSADVEMLLRASKVLEFECWWWRWSSSKVLSSFIDCPHSVNPSSKNSYEQVISYWGCSIGSPFPLMHLSNTFSATSEREEYEVDTSIDVIGIKWPPNIKNIREIKKGQPHSTSSLPTWILQIGYTKLF